MLADRRRTDRMDGGKSFRESIIRVIPSQSPERGTVLRRTCSITGLGGAWCCGRSLREFLGPQDRFGTRLARRAPAQPSLVIWRLRLTARASAGTSLVMQ